MTLVELVSEVYGLTGRPDLDVRTINAVKRATLRAHHLDFFSRDLYEVPLVFDTPAYLQEIEYRTVIPRFRAIKYLRHYDAVTDSAGKFLNKITPEETLNNYGETKTDVFYIAGDVIQIRSSILLEYLLSGWYRHPDITDSGFSSWIADEHPSAIVYAAAREIFKSIGKDEEYQRMASDVAEQDMLVRMTGISEVGV
jgi:hypothetical protein